MRVSFYKYQGTGNDFVMIDDRSCGMPIDRIDWVQNLCDRKFGIGSDGLIVLRPVSGYDFEMIYFNADGSQSMCGNGARCAVAFARFLGIISSKTNFLAIDGPHEAVVDDALVHLKMGDVSGLETRERGDHFVHTGSPHHIRQVQEIHHYPVVDEGKQIRYSSIYSPGGTNVNFIEPVDSGVLYVRTYERGVEDETYSCGTGVTAAALVFGDQKGLREVAIQTLGGELSVRFEKEPNGEFKNIWLTGPAKQVFQGEIHL